MNSNLKNEIDGTNQPVLIIGLGRSGVAAAKLLLAQGRRVWAVDGSSGARLTTVARELVEAGAKVQLECQRLPDAEFEYAVISPGVSIAEPIVQDLIERGISVLPEFELGWRNLKAPTVAVTGSNGKSTVVKWIAETFAAAGQAVAIGGNYGTPVCEIAATTPLLDWLILELSSFQLETCMEFRADAAVLLNVNANHLDRHRDMRDYEEIKMRIFKNSRPDDHCILPVDLASSPYLPQHPTLWTTFGSSESAQWMYRDGAVWWDGGHPGLWNSEPSARTWAGGIRDNRLCLAGTHFDNRILGVAAAAVCAVCDATGIGADWAARTAQDFEGLPHRMQRVPTSSELIFINDSKATNLAAMRAALDMLAGPIRLIAGGRAKESSFAAIKDALREKVAKAYLIGESAEMLEKQWGAVVECEVCGELYEAVERSVRQSSAGDTVLLSPGCASFDQFASFEERGFIFIKFAKDLAGKYPI